MTNKIHLLPGLGGLLAATLLWSVAASALDTEETDGRDAPQVVSTFAGKISHVKAKNNNNDVKTNSTAPVDVPDMQLTVKAAKGPIVIFFSAQARAVDLNDAGSAYSIVKAQVDGADISPSNDFSDYAFSSTKDLYSETHTASFFYNNKTAGKRAISILWYTSNGDEVIMDERQVTVFYRKKK